MTGDRSATFNSPLEAGLRALGVLVPALPRALDLQRLVAFDYLVVHSGDIGGPSSLHPRLPQQSAELLVRRAVVERGLHLMIHRGLVTRAASVTGFEYRAEEMAGAFLAAMTAPYAEGLRERGEWVVQRFGDMSEHLLQMRMSEFFGRWIQEFQAVQQSLGVEG